MRRLLLAVVALGAAAPAGAFFGPFKTERRPFELVDKLEADARWPDVIRELKALQTKRLRQADEKRLYLKLGRAYEAQRKLDLALSAYQYGVEQFARDARLQLALGQLYHQIGLDDRAMPVFEKVLRLDPGNGSAHLGLAESFEALGLLHLSTASYRRALDGGFAGDAKVWGRFAGVLHAMRDDEQAENAASQSLELEPTAEVYLLQARIIRRGGRAADALYNLERGRALGPGAALFDLQEAMWRLEDGEFDLARTMAESLVSRDPDLAPALWILAEVDLHRGREVDAARTLRRIEDLAPRFPFAAAAAARIRRTLTPEVSLR